MRWLKALERHPSAVVLGACVFVLSLVLSLATVAFVLVRLPAHYFSANELPPFWAHRPAWQRALGRLGKNLLGLALCVLGVVLSLPGVPGQGLLTIFIGIVLLDFPGKRRLERRIISVPGIFQAANRLRARFDRPALVLHEPREEPPPQG